MRKFVFLTITMLLLIGCSNNYGVNQVSKNEVEKAMEKDALVLIYLDDDEHYLEKLDELAKEYKKEVMLYDTHMEDGKTVNEERIFPNDEKRKYEFNALYKIKNNKIVDELLLDEYLGSEREREIKYILE